MADTQDLGSCAERRGGSSPFIRTIVEARQFLALLFLWKILFLFNIFDTAYSFLYNFNMKRYFTISLTALAFSALNVLTYFLLGIITENSAFSGIFSITYPLQFVVAVLISFFSCASNIRANKENNKNCEQSGMILGILFGAIIFGIVAIFVDNYIAFMNLDPKIYHTFTLMAIGQLFLGYVCNIIIEKFYFDNKDKLGNFCSLGFIALNLLSTVISALITKNQTAIFLSNFVSLFIYIIIWLGFTIKKFKFDFNILKNFKYESMNILDNILMLLIYLFGFRLAFSFGEEYYLAISFINLITDPIWDAVNVTSKIAKIDISKSCYNYKKAIKYSAVISITYIALCVALFFGLFGAYNVSLKIAIIYLCIQIADILVNIFKSNLQTFLQLEYSPAKATAIKVFAKSLRTILSVILITPFNTDIAQISCGVLGLILFLILRFKNYKLNKSGILIRKTDNNLIEPNA